MFSGGGGRQEGGNQTANGRQEGVQTNGKGRWGEKSVVRDRYEGAGVEPSAAGEVVVAVVNPRGGDGTAPDPEDKKGYLKENHARNKATVGEVRWFSLSGSTTRTRDSVPHGRHKCRV